MSLATEVRVCDFVDTVSATVTTPCRRLADYVCMLCHKDGCKKHLPQTLTIGCAIESTGTDQNHAKTTTRREYGPSFTKPLCQGCANVVCSLTAPLTDNVPVLETAGNSIVENIRAAAAADALRLPPRER